MTWDRGPGRVLAVLGAATVALSACGGHHLADYDFRDRTLAVVYFGTPRPDLVTGGYDLDTDNPVEAVVSASGRILREVEARRARARLDSAATRVDLTARMADRTLDRAGRYLGTRPVQDEADADYLLEVDLFRTGLEARGRAAYLFVTGEVVLLDARTGREIWDRDLDGYDRVTPWVSGGPAMLGDVVTAGALNTVTVAEFERMLGGLADFVADRVARELREDLRDIRD
ncbi:MAG: hypothetical protein ACOCUW_00010 [Gemmatimonadota bacterium]